MQIDLPVVWAVIIGLGVLIYVMLGGFDRKPSIFDVWR